MTRPRVLELAAAAAIDSSVGLVASLAGAALVIMLADHERRAELVRRSRSFARTVSGADARAWRLSPRAVFARRIRAELVASEHAELEASVS